MRHFIKTENEEFINIKYIVAVSRNRVLHNAFSLHMEDGSQITCAYCSEEECKDKLNVLLQELCVMNRWVVFEEKGLAVKANIVKYIKRADGGIKFATEDDVYTIPDLNDGLRHRYQDLLLGKRTETTLDEVGLSKFKA